MFAGPVTDVREGGATCAGAHGEAAEEAVRSVVVGAGPHFGGPRDGGSVIAVNQGGHEGLDVKLVKQVVGQINRRLLEVTVRKGF